MGDSIENCKLYLRLSHYFPVFLPPFVVSCLPLVWGSLADLEIVSRYLRLVSCPGLWGAAWTGLGAVGGVPGSGGCGCSA